MDQGRYSESQQYGRDDSQQYGGQYDQQYSQRQSQVGDGEDAGLGVNIQQEGGGQGVTVVRVFPNTPAEQMGIEEGDRITEVNGQQVQSVQSFISRIRNMEPGQEVEIQIDRDQEQFAVSGQLESREEALARTQGSQWQQGGQSWQGGQSSQDETWQTGSRVQDLRQGGQGQYGRSGERQAGYDEYQGGYQQEQRFGTRQRSIDGQFEGRSRIIDDQGLRGGSEERFDDGGFGESRSGFRSSQEGGRDSAGGVQGGLRTRPDNDQDWNR
jgi:hypothetical protein